MRTPDNRLAGPLQALTILALLAACGCSEKSPSTPGDADDWEADPADFVAVVDNPYRPLVPGTVLIYEGAGDDGEAERVIVEVLAERRAVAGVECAVVRDRVWADGELVEDTRDWFVQHVNGDLWYFGEAVSNYEDGVLVDTDGSWEAGVDGARPGILVHAQPVIGEPYQQEYYEGEAEDMAEALSLSATVDIAFGQFTDCLQTRDWTPLEPGVEEHKFYAPGIGPVLELKVAGGSGRIELVDRLLPEARPPAAEFGAGSNHPFLPLVAGTTLVYEGESDGELEHVEVEFAGETRLVDGVLCAVVRDRVWVDGELVEDTFDWFAQHQGGDLWYFGEDVKNYEGGVLVDTEGSWEAGTGGARAGILMPAAPAIGEVWRQEFYAGEAEDMARLEAVDETVSIALGDYAGCRRTREWTPLEPGVAEEKAYAPGLGLILETVVEGGTGGLELIAIVAR